MLVLRQCLPDANEPHPWSLLMPLCDQGLWTWDALPPLLMTGEPLNHDSEVHDDPWPR